VGIPGKNSKYFTGNQEFRKKKFIGLILGIIFLGWELGKRDFGILVTGGTGF